jgi:hypothetical protein
MSHTPKNALSLDDLLTSKGKEMEDAGIESSRMQAATAAALEAGQNALNELEIAELEAKLRESQRAEAEVAKQQAATLEEYLDALKMLEQEG